MCVNKMVEPTFNINMILHYVKSEGTGGLLSPPNCELSLCACRWRERHLNERKCDFQLVYDNIMKSLSEDIFFKKPGLVLALASLESIHCLYLDCSVRLMKMVLLFGKTIVQANASVQ